MKKEKANKESTTKLKSNSDRVFVFRVFISVVFIAYSVDCLMQGSEFWDQMGQKTQFWNVGFLPIAWGIAMIIAILACSCLLLIGFLSPLSSTILAIILIVDYLPSWVLEENTINLYPKIVTLGTLILFIITGPGSYALDNVKIFNKKKKTLKE